ncbi:MAG: radical SAM protein [Planctomycetes bacterium]|nr:radical SAM protein [Planctomycetota bacterium]
MIGISRLLLGRSEPSDRLRYARPAGQGGGRKPVVVWNCGRRCNLACAHCYSASDCFANDVGLSTCQARAMIDDLAAFGAPVLLFSGGEPLVRGDLDELIGYAGQKGLRTVLSTNGTLIDSETAGRLARTGLAYAGISLDGLAEINDHIRGQAGAFDMAVAGMRNCLVAGLKVGLRFTMNSINAGEIHGMFALAERMGLHRICFYHLVRTGRAAGAADLTPTNRQTRQALDTIIDLTARSNRARDGMEVLTVDNHADGGYLYLRMLAEGNPLARRTLELLNANGGNASGVGIGCISWDGKVHPDQFWRSRVLGNITERPFSQIWPDAGCELLAKLRDRRRHLHCRCLNCRFLDACNGNLRARADAAGDMWGDDPACYLTDEEIRPVAAKAGQT